MAEGGALCRHTMIGLKDNLRMPPSDSKLKHCFFRRGSEGKIYILRDKRLDIDCLLLSFVPVGALSLIKLDQLVRNGSRRQNSQIRKQKADVLGRRIVAAGVLRRHGGNAGPAVENGVPT